MPSARSLRWPNQRGRCLNHLLYAVQDNTESHRISSRIAPWDLLDLVGKDQAHTLLRQSVRYCVRAESNQRSAAWNEPRTLLPKMLRNTRLLDRGPARASLKTSGSMN